MQRANNATRRAGNASTARVIAGGIARPRARGLATRGLTINVTHVCPVATVPSLEKLEPRDIAAIVDARGPDFDRLIGELRAKYITRK